MELAAVMSVISAYQPYAVRLRREFHRSPELSGQEFQTRKILVRELKEMDIPYRLLPGTGIIAELKGDLPGKNKLLRADIDALPVKECAENLSAPKVCVSETENISHACGHDAHMAMLLSAMHVLNELRHILCGTVYCCFEEGEETNCGYPAMLQALEEYQIDSCFALHVYSGLTSGKISLEAGDRMAGQLRIGVRFCGKAGHGSRPDQAINPIIPAAHMVTQLHSAFMNQLDPESPLTLGICQLNAGSAYNVIPEYADLGGSVRYFRPETGERALEIICKLAEATAACHKCTVIFDKENRISLPPVINDEQVVRSVRKTMQEISGADRVFQACPHWYASETFSKYLERYPGALGLVGIRNERCGFGAPHHSERFDVDESAMVHGICAEVAFALAP